MQKRGNADFGKNRKNRGNKTNTKAYKIMLIVLCCLFLCAAILAGGFGIVRAMGKSRLMKEADTVRPVIDAALPEEILTKEEESRWQEGWVKYKGVVYAYNEDLLTFLIMGIDKKNEVREVAEGTDGGQADALFLAVMNPKDRSIKVIAINRNTMADIDVYDQEGNYVTTTKAQIATQHGFGNGVEESCEYQRDAVQKLFYQMPVHGYAAINMSAIAAINDAVGGVDVTLKEDLTKINREFWEGNTVHLFGEDAFWYVKYRDVDQFGSADSRLVRQKQYLNAFIGKAKEAVGKDISIVTEMYQAVMSQMCTDISLDEAVYLASELVDYHFDEQSLYTLEGETVMGELFEEFYPDEDRLYEMILEVFYEEVGG